MASSLNPADYDTRIASLRIWFGDDCVSCGRTVTFNTSNRVGTTAQIGHMTSQYNGGSNRCEDLALQCIDCNQRQGKRNACEVFTGQVVSGIRLFLRYDPKPAGTPWPSEAERAAYVPARTGWL